MMFDSGALRKTYIRIRLYLRNRAVRRRQIAYLKLWLGRLLLWGGAVGVGMLAVGFAQLSDHAIHLFRSTSSDYPWWPFVIAPFGGALCVWLTRRWFGGAEGSGIPQTIAEMTRPEVPGWKPLLSLRIIVGKVLVGVAAVGSGFSLGREGPTVQVGASLLNALHRALPGSLHIPRTHMLVAGGAAGIAAAFNTPLAGIAFAIEELTRSVEARMSGLIITAIVLAGIVSQTFLGKSSYFGQIAIGGSDREMALAVAVTALVCGASGGLFSRMLIMGSISWRGPLADYRRRRPVRFAFLCGLLVAALGYASGGLAFGSGYAETRALLDGDSQLAWYYGPVKFIATLIAYLSGLPGGIFAPSLAIGAGVGNNLAPLLGQADAPGMLLVLCMAGFLAAVTQAPITSFIIVMEMVDGYSVIIGLMAVSLLSAGVSRIFSKPLYHTVAKAMVERNVAAARESASTRP
ncbi:chloride channel protein [Methyloversatilis thermotolerans]|uniref:chloride channel protein n=1 Tax=Methyloversatilis thermotolerans TaxID=1346290 RepID=UPI00036DE591|nr:chloride channel protein [Methyloversatilis thermotolerans]